MGWLRLVGSLKVQVSFAEYRLFYRALLQKRPIILRSLLIVATPQCVSVCVYSKAQPTPEKTVPMPSRPACLAPNLRVGVWI